MLEYESVEPLETQRNNLTVSHEQALLVNVTLPTSSLPARESLAELAALAEAAGADVVGNIRQNRRRPHPATYVGSGKAKEIGERAEELEADVVIFDNDLSPAQIRELEELIACKIIDRSELILDIFAARARSRESQLQVDLAQLQYTYPRLTRMWSHLDTVVGAAGGAVGAVGGIGTRGTGEKQLEIDRRLVSKRLVSLRRQIEEIGRRKQRQVQSRRNQFTVSLVGYTNGGKSTLMNTVTGIDTFVKDQLFATLDTKTTRWNLQQNNHVLLSDTVGFVRDLPHHLVASFRATLEEALHADLLLHVLDVSHPHAEVHIETVNRVLAEIGAEKNDLLLLLNKTDKKGCESQCDTLKTLYPDAIAISANTGAGIEKLTAAVMERVAGREVLLSVRCPQGNGKIPAFLRGHGQIISEDYDDSHVIIEARLGRRLLPALKRLQGESCEIEEI